MIIIGHRGAKGLAPENTKSSFEAALKSKADMIEFDIRTSADNILVINHDPKISGLDISKTTYSHLKHTKPDLLTLREVLEVIDGKRPLLVEIKPGADIRTVIKALRKVKLPKGSWFGSFDFKILKALRNEFPDSELLVIHKWSGIIARRRASVLGTRKIAMNNRWLYSWYVRALTKGGYQLYPYSMNRPKRIKAWEKAGMSGYVTDFP